MIDGKDFSVPRHVQDQHSLVGTTPQAARAESWELQLSARQIEILEAEAGGLLQLLGYATIYWPRVSGRTGYEAWSSSFRKFLTGPYNLARGMRRVYVRSKYREEIMNRR
jgi:hypothetical protein